MYIASPQVENIFKLHMHKLTASTDVRPTYATWGADSLLLSGQVTEMRGIKQHLSSLPDIRMDKVNEIMRAMETGSYKTSELDIASAMFTSAASVSRGA